MSSPNNITSPLAGPSGDAISSSDDDYETTVPNDRSNKRRVRDCKIYKWNLKFSGDNPRCSLEGFLEQVEDRRALRHITYVDLFSSAGELFEGTALLWYRNRRSEFQGWTHLVQELRTSFQDANYDENLLDEIRRRTQAPGERVIHYLTKIQSLFSRLHEPISEGKKLHIISKNILPEYQMHLQTLNYATVRELEVALLRLEVGRMNQLSYSEPPTSFLIEPELSHPPNTNRRNPVKQINHPRVESNRTISNRSNQPRAAQAYGGSVVCWNCGGSHKFRSCSQPWKTFCHRCGRINFSAWDCPNCNRAGNASVPLGAEVVEPTRNIRPNFVLPTQPSTSRGTHP